MTPSWAFFYYSLRKGEVRVLVFKVTSCLRDAEASSRKMSSDASENASGIHRTMHAEPYRCARETKPETRKTIDLFPTGVGGVLDPEKGSRDKTKRMTKAPRAPQVMGRRPFSNGI